MAEWPSPYGGEKEMIRYWLNQRGKIIATGTVMLAVLALLAPAVAQECQTPLFVDNAMFGANVMVLADNSLSMNEVIYSPAYNRDKIYSGRFKTTSTYKIAKDGQRTPHDFNSGWEIFPPANLVNSDNGQDGWYYGNYLNWVYYNADPLEVLKIPQVTRIQVLKSILAEIVDRSSRLDFGVTVFNGQNGGNIIAKCGTNPVSVKAIIDGITANTYTPLGEASEDILDYFADTGPAAPIQVACQYNFLLVVTDGLPTLDVDVSPYLFDADGDHNDPGSCETIGAPYPNSVNCSDHFDDVLYYMAHEDLRPDLDGDQFINSYVVGFNENAQLLQEAAYNGNGFFFEANNAVELFLSIEYALQDILRKISAGSAVAVVSTERGTDNRLYRGKFMPVDWDGYLECYALPYSDGDGALWEAGSILQSRSPVSREIFTAIGSEYIYFSSSYASKLRALMNVATDDEAAALIDWARGEDVAGLRDRQGWILGDIVHSTPVVVGPPAGFEATESFRDFYVANEFRRKMVYVGANDGMIHAFDADDGEEAWAFVPQFALPSFTVMADSGYCHTYTCDQTVSVKDVQVDGQWQTILVSGGREGGGSIFALNVTDPNAPTVLWQNTLPNGLPYESEVVICSIGGNATVLVGSGLDEVDQKAFIYSYDIKTGLFNGEIGLNGGKLRNKGSKPAVMDLNLDGQVDLVYMADLNSTIWRYETEGNPNPEKWKKYEIFEDQDREITANPVVAHGPNGEVLIYVGTGAYLTEDDKLSSNSNSFYCIIDHHDGNKSIRGDLVDQTSSINPVNGANGWYVDLWNMAGERVSETAVIVAETVIFTSFAPVLDPCVAGGESFLYQMAYDTGGLTNSKEMTDPSDRSISLGNGIASYPVIDLTTGNVVVQSSDASIKVNPIAAIYERMTVRSWQESYDNVNQSFLP